MSCTRVAHKNINKLVIPVQRKVLGEEDERSTSLTLPRCGMTDGAAGTMELIELEVGSEKCLL